MVTPTSDDKWGKLNRKVLQLKISIYLKNSYSRTSKKRKHSPKGALTEKRRRPTNRNKPHRPNQAIKDRASTSNKKDLQRVLQLSGRYFHGCGIKATFHCRQLLCHFNTSRAFQLNHAHCAFNIITHPYFSSFSFLT